MSRKSSQQEPEDKKARKDKLQQSRTKLQDDLLRIVSRNLIELFDSEPESRRKVAEECCISQSSLSKWTSDDYGALPGMEYVYMIARHFNVSTDWIMTEHNKKTDVDHLNESLLRPDGTYCSWMMELLPLVKSGALDADSIRDPILRYLTEETLKILERPNMPESKKRAWLDRIIRSFSIPIPQETDPELCERLLSNDPEIADPDQLSEYAALASVISDPEKLEESLKRCHLTQQ